MIANTLTFSRLLLTFVVIALFGGHAARNIVLLAILVLIFVMDAVDGVVARKRKETSAIGAALDTIADRIIENTFWIYFATVGHIPLWMPVTVMTRGILTDGLQQTFGVSKSRWAHAITRSRTSRALYGTLKMLTFLCLGSGTIFKHPTFEQGSLTLATVTIAFCLIRGLPVFVHAAHLQKKTTPKSPENTRREKHEKQFHPIHQKTREFTRR